MSDIKMSQANFHIESKHGTKYQFVVACTQSNPPTVSIRMGKVDNDPKCDELDEILRKCMSEFGYVAAAMMEAAYKKLTF